MTGHWDQRWRDRIGDSPGFPAPAWVLCEFAQLLPRDGDALDLVCGCWSIGTNGGSASSTEVFGMTRCWAAVALRSAIETDCDKERPMV